MREISNSDLTIMLMGLSGEARKKVFKNLSERLAVMIAEDMELMRAVKLCDIADTSLKIFNTLIHLSMTAEIVCQDVEAMVTIEKIFNIKADIKNEGRIKKEESELIRIIRDYNTASHRTVKTTWE